MIPRKSGTATVHLESNQNPWNKLSQYVCTWFTVMDSPVSPNSGLKLNLYATGMSKKRYLYNR